MAHPTPTRRATLGAAFIAALAEATGYRPAAAQWGAAAAGPAGGSATPAHRPTRMISPAAAGSGPDVAARLFAEGFSRRRGHPVAVENRPGGVGAVAADAFTQARPGEALLSAMCDLLTVAPLTEAHTPYAEAANFVPISTMATDLMALSVPASMPVRTLAEFVDYARARPGALNWHATQSTALYIALNAFLRRHGLDMTYVAFRGTPPALLDLAGGRIHAVVGPLAATLPLARDGRIRMLAIPSHTRAAAAPELPTAAEAGFPDLWVEGFVGLFGWRGMPEVAREAFSADARAVLAEPALVERYAASGLLARGSTPRGFEEALEEHRGRWAALAREFGAAPRG